MIDFLFKAMAWALAVTVITVMYMTYRSMQDKSARMYRANQLAESVGCENLGTAQYQPQLMFFDCRGKITVVRIP